MPWASSSNNNYLLFLFSQKPSAWECPEVDVQTAGRGRGRSHLATHIEFGRDLDASRTAATQQVAFGSVGKPTSHLKNSTGRAPLPARHSVCPQWICAGSFDSGPATHAKRHMGRTGGAEGLRQPSECCPEVKGPSPPKLLCPRLSLLTQRRRTDGGCLLGPGSPGRPLSSSGTPCSPSSWREVSSPGA